MSSPRTPGQRLAQRATEAAEVRQWQTHPDVVALQVERTRTLVDRMIWGGIVAGLLLTTTNVQQFTAKTIGATPGTFGWWAAWLLDPTVALILLGVLVAERRVAPGRITLGPWPRAAKWSLVAATYCMNTWESYAAGNLAGVVLHSVPPLVVFMGAEAVTDCRDKLTEYVDWAAARAGERAHRTIPAHVPVDSPADIGRDVGPVAGGSVRDGTPQHGTSSNGHTRPTPAAPSLGDGSDSHPRTVTPGTPVPGSLNTERSAAHPATPPAGDDQRVRGESTSSQSHDQQRSTESADASPRSGVICR